MNRHRPEPAIGPTVGPAAGTTKPDTRSPAGRVTRLADHQHGRSLPRPARSATEYPQLNPAASDRVVPFPRKPADDAIPSRKGIPGADGSTYNRPDERQPGWGFTGQVEYVGGAEGDRMRAQLADVIRDLLEWAANQSRDQDREAA
jgi:hypothetical protein